MTAERRCSKFSINSASRILPRRRAAGLGRALALDPLGHIARHRG
jgi:hypothetical protein